MTSFYYYTTRPRRRRPRSKEYGIKIRTKKGDIGTSWLAENWTDLIYNSGSGDTFVPGRTYARKGQVLQVDVQRGHVHGIVQGAPVLPHKTSIKIEIPDYDYAKNIAMVCRQRPVLAAKILSGEMTEKMASEMSEAGVADVFSPSWIIETSCTCHAWYSVCKHVMAISHVLAEEIDYDSFWYWRILGVDRHHILDILDDVSADANPEYSCIRAGTPDKYYPVQSDAPLASESSPINLDKFWGSHNDAGSYESMPIPSDDAATMKRWGGFPMWCGTEKFLDIMDEIYKNASIRGANTYAGVDTTTKKHKKS